VASESDDGESQNREPATVIHHYPVGPDAIEQAEGHWFSEKEDAMLFPYLYARMSSTYYYPGARTQLPIARKIDGEGPVDQEDTAVVFQLGARQCRREVRVDFERLGKPPEIPKAKDTYEEKDGGLKGTLLRHFTEVHPGVLTKDGGKKIYRTTAYYTYALNRPPTEGERLRVGVQPFTKMEVDDDDERLDPFDIENEDID
jgi:hypothetical protein